MESINYGTPGIDKATENTFTAPQRMETKVEDNSIDFTQGNNFEISATIANVTVANMTGAEDQCGTIVIDNAENITGWSSEFIWKNIPTDLTGTETFAYFIRNSTQIMMGKVT